MSRFKVWVNIEEIEDAEGEEVYQDCGLPDALGKFETLAEAARFLRSLPGWDDYSAGTSDYDEGKELKAPSEYPTEEGSTACATPTASTGSS